MRTTSKLLAVALAATMQSAMADNVTLDFEDITTTALLNGSYGGVTVSGAAFAATSAADGCTGTELFTRQGSCGALWITESLSQVDTGVSKTLRLTLTEGFVDAVSFAYSGNISFPNLAVHVFDAAGNELGKGLSGLTGAACGPNSSFVFCNWSTLSYSFTGTARSVTFSASDAAVLLDDIKFITPSATNQTPEPASAALALGALGALGIARRRRSAR